MHGINTETYRPAADRAAEWAATGLPGKYGVGVFGRVRAQKGVDRFVDAMIELLPQYPDFTAVVVGQVTLDQREFAAQQHAKVSAAGLAQRMCSSRQPRRGRCLWLRRMTMSGPARWEGFGLCADAMANARRWWSRESASRMHSYPECERGSLRRRRHATLKRRSANDGRSRARPRLGAPPRD
jgi:mannosyltransferase